MQNQNIFETAVQVLPLLQQSQWEKSKGGLYHPAQPVDITSYCNSRAEGELLAQVITRILYETPPFTKDFFLHATLDETNPGDGRIVLQGTLPGASDIKSFREDTSLSMPASDVRIVTQLHNLWEAIQYVRHEAAANEWKRAEGGA